MQMRLFLSAVFFCIPYMNAFASLGAARVVSFSGEVKVNGQEVRVGDEVAAGHTVRTGATGMAKLLLVDKSIVDLASNTSFVVESSVEGVGSTTRLDFGTVRSSIQKKLEKKIKFQMRTKTSVLAVRGTEFIVRSGGTGKAGGFQDQVTVRDGQVAVGSGGTARLLNAGDQMMALGRMVGNQMQVDPGQLKVVQLKPEVLQAVVSQATVQDQTFMHKVEVAKNDGPSGRPMGPPGGGESTLGVAAANVVREMGPARGPASGPEGAPDRRPPPPPPPMGNLNIIDQSAAQNKTIQGVKLHVIFTP